MFKKLQEFVGICKNVNEFVRNLEIVRIFMNCKNTQEFVRIICLHQFVKNLREHVRICEFTRTNIFFIICEKIRRVCKN